MSIVLWILLTLIVFSFIVFVHELGHFLVARFTKTRVEEFGLWLPPRAVKLFTDTRWTLFSLNWLPIGWFVRIHGEDPSTIWVHTTDSFVRKSWFQKSCILLAGVAMNFLLAYILFFILFLSGAKPIGINPFDTFTRESYFLPTATYAESIGFLTYSGDIIFSSVSWSLAEKMWVEKFDRFRGIINGWEPIPWCSPESWRTCSPEKIIHEIQHSPKITLFLENASWSLRSLMLTPESGRIGSLIGYEEVSIHTGFTYPTTILWASRMAGEEFLAQLSLTSHWLALLLQKLIFPMIESDRKEAINMVAWPIGIGGFFVQAVEMDMPFTIILLIIAMISLSLGFFNLLPIPWLDGGRFITTSLAHLMNLFSWKIESYIRIEQKLSTAWMVLLLTLSLLVAFSDISKFFH